MQFKRGFEREREKREREREREISGCRKTTSTFIEKF